MFNLFSNKKKTSKVKVNKTEITEIENRIVKLEHRVQKIECEHNSNSIEFREPILIFSSNNFGRADYRKVCTDCNEILKTYDSRQKWLKEKAVHYDNIVEQIHDEIENRK